MGSFELVLDFFGISTKNIDERGHLACELVVVALGSQAIEQFGSLLGLLDEFQQERLEIRRLGPKQGTSSGSEN